MLNRVQLKKMFAICFVLMLIFTAGRLNAQIVTNGNFESSNVADSVNGFDVKGWFIQTGPPVTTAPKYSIESDTVEDGNHALKILVNGLGNNPWDIQAVADSLHVRPGGVYNYSIWAKAAKPGARVDFTLGNYSYTEYKSIRPANLTTTWQKFTMQFTVDNNTWIRGPISCSYAGNIGNAIYVDNLQIVDANAANKPVIVEAESGQLGSNFSVLQNGNITYVTEKTNYTGLTNPGDTSRMITYQVTLPDSGSYNLFAHLRVGPNGFNDDSFFYGKGFGEKNDTSGADWVFINGLAAAGFSDSTDYVDGAGTVGSQIWKWVNVSKNSYQGTPGVTFYASLDSLTKTFQIGSREDGLDIDKLAFGKTSLFFTVKNLNNVEPGSTSIVKVDTGVHYTGPYLAKGQGKFIGCAYDNPDTTFLDFWNQVTPGNAGKFGSVATTSDTSTWNWAPLDADYNLAENNHLLFKDHNLIWGQQQPAWITAAGFDTSKQRAAVEQWIRMVGARYPKMDMIDVVNEPLPGHAPAPYAPALGGTGATGWDWVIWAFQKARQYMPANTKLLINEYNVLNSTSNTTAYLQIINLLKARGLIDGIGIQAHRFELENTDTNMIKTNLNAFGATGLPVYISEFDLGNFGDTGIPNDSVQLSLYKKIFPVLWRHPSIKGFTFWGYQQGLTWQTTVYLVRSDGSSRPALTWLVQFLKDNPVTGVKEIASQIPVSYELKQNFPNPFNPTTNIQYNIPKTSKVSLRIYDVLGRLVQTLVNTEQKPGNYSVTFNAQNLSSGVYFYQINAGSFSQTKKLMLLK